MDIYSLTDTIATRGEGYPGRAPTADELAAAIKGTIDKGITSSEILFARTRLQQYRAQAAITDKNPAGCSMPTTVVGEFIHNDCYEGHLGADAFSKVVPQLETAAPKNEVELANLGLVHYHYP